MSQLENRQRKRILLYSAFDSVQAFSGLDEVHPHWARAICLTQSTDSDVNLIQKCLTKYLGIL